MVDSHPFPKFEVDGLAGLREIEFYGPRRRTLMPRHELCWNSKDELNRT